ncbi:CU044_2847 family protein [Amycolatopsis sp. NBC_01480]|uniref:CU044_2847 family protein n=1 Tax=Amycolatopsis sp. NBC_01480 TaxID=2903562 RepID=UPI002E2C1238|nr:CU044_2847 family protein [Amycolatopsis sp. NBC_01480]
MGTVVEMPLEDGSTVLVEVAEDEQRLQRVGRAGSVVRDSAETLEEALRRVKPAVATVLHQIRDLATPPDTVKIEFGVKLTAEAGVVIAKAATEANFKLSLEWSAGKRQPAEPADPAPPAPPA